TALLQAFADWTGELALLINLEGHGREEVFEEIDLSRTVGWFTSLFPVHLQLESSDDTGEALKRIKEQLRHVPNRGLGYGVLRYLSATLEESRAWNISCQPQVIFNYLGQLDQTGLLADLLKLTNEPSGQDESPRGERSHLLDINGSVIEGVMQFDWTYSTQLYRPTTIEALATGYLNKLRALIEHCLQPGIGGYTPSDFPLASLTQQDLDALLSGHRDIEDIYPLSPMQQGMLFHSLYDREIDVYFRQASWNLHGNLNVAAFEQAWQQVIARHTILRT